MLPSPSLASPPLASSPAVPAARSASTPARLPRRAGEASRERILRAALERFAERGYARTSTREIAEAADANVASIAYWFGDKAGLYRSLLDVPVSDFGDWGSRPVFADVLRGFFAGFVEPLRHGDLPRLLMKLHMREMVEPTGLARGPIAETIRPEHEALVGALVRRLGLARADDDVARLAISIAALGVHLHCGRDVTDALAPRLHARADAADVWLDRLVVWADGMVEAEVGRRRAAARPPRRARVGG